MAVDNPKYPRPPRTELGLERFASIMLGNLDSCYQLLLKKDGRNIPFDKFMMMIGQSVHPDTEDPMEMVKQAFKADVAVDDRYIAELALGPIIVATIFILRALGEWKKESDINKAWSYMADGCYWAGVAVAGKGMGVAKKQDDRELALKGAKGKKAIYGKIQEHAFTLARNNRPPLKGWRSRLQAAENIHAQVNEYVMKNHEHLHPVKVATIYDWLGLMPERARLFSPSLSKDEI
ncbi:hypothetical protein [Hydrogenophaga palleronii]|uniref:hypothetical protein n=1 Tax=Hydrogenophaga palleronii TaxID=65655 RepID=UPI000ACA347F|nr:hypothetical protein [Hydrogenophaga palleronii]